MKQKIKVEFRGGMYEGGSEELSDLVENSADDENNFHVNKDILKINNLN